MAEAETETERGQGRRGGGGGISSGSDFGLNNHRRHHPFSRFIIQGNENKNELKSGKKEEEEDDREEGLMLELSLGLSSNGRFGVERSKSAVKNNLIIPRSVSSIPRFSIPPPKEEEEEEEEEAKPPPPSPPLPTESPFGQQACSGVLTRAWSVPSEMMMDGEKKRKELQCLRRMEAKRRRSDKDKQHKIYYNNNCGQQPVWTSVGNPGFLEAGGGTSERRISMAQVALPPPPGSQGSGGSGSSGMSTDFEAQKAKAAAHGTDKSVETKSPTSVQSSSVSNDLNSSALMIKRSRSSNAHDMVKAVKDNPIPKHGLTSNGSSDSFTNALSDMPCVSTKGEGPNGRRIDGFLYGYRKREEVRILCVCHGSFFTPAEFVKHAGGGEVENPLRRIVVNLSPLLS